MDAMAPTLAPAEALSPAERCDRCGARACVRAVLPEGELMFCRHHGREYAGRLRSVAISIEDATGALEGMEAPSVN